MAFLMVSRRCPRELGMHAVARLLCTVVLLWVCSLGHDSSIAAASAARQVGRRTASPSAATQPYQHSSGVPQAGKFGLSRASAAWQLPSGPVKKALIIFDDLYAQPYEFWDRSSSCPLCTGLPEKRKIVSDAIARNYAVLIPHPLDLDGMREDGGWDSLSTDSPVILHVLFILAEWKGIVGLQDDVPTVALGVSTGGEILSTLGLLPGLLESMAMMISNGVIEAFESATQDYPPTIFIHMPKDTGTAAGVYYDRKLLSANRVPTKEVRWLEHSVTQDWFAQLIPGMDLFISRRIYRHLIEEGWLDDKTGFLKPDSDFLYEWHAKVREWNILPPDPQDGEFLLFEDSVLEELSVADAYHVTLARHNDDLFAWFEGGYKVQDNGENAAMPLFASI